MYAFSFLLLYFCRVKKDMIFIMKKYEYINYLTENIQMEHSGLIHDDNIFGGQKVLVFFTNTQTHAKGEAELPTYKWIDKGNLSKKDIIFCEKALHWNASNIFQYAREGGFNLAKTMDD